MKDIVRVLKGEQEPYKTIEFVLYFGWIMTGAILVLVSCYLMAALLYAVS